MSLLGTISILVILLIGHKKIRQNPLKRSHISNYQYLKKSQKSLGKKINSGIREKQKKVEMQDNYNLDSFYQSLDSALSYETWYKKTCLDSNQCPAWLTNVHYLVLPYAKNKFNNATAVFFLRMIYLQKKRII